MFLRKYMSLLGVGTATISLQLNKENHKRNNELEGIFLVKGGTIIQHLKRIEYELLVVDFRLDKEVIVESNTILTSKKIGPGDTFSYPFCYQVSDQVLLKHRIFKFRTRLYFQKGFKMEEHEIISITN